MRVLVTVLGVLSASERFSILSPQLLFVILLVTAFGALAEDCRLVSEEQQSGLGSDLYYAERTAAQPTDSIRIQAHLAFFTSKTFRLEVLDLGAAVEPVHAGLADAFRAEGIPAGVNGGFFHPDWQPLGLMISQGHRVNRFENAKLLSGVVYSDGRGIHLMRRSRFREQPGITALLQTGPYLVEAGRAVRGLSDRNARRRTFIATDWRGNWALGATSSRNTLAELAECLASPQALTPWRVERAINLDGGSSTGFFFDRGPEKPVVVLEPIKRVRNLLGIRPR